MLDHVSALKDAGVRIVEVPLNSPEPIASIRRLVEAFGHDMVCGAGTVLTAERVNAVAEAGGRIIVAPDTRPEVIHVAAQPRPAPDAGVRHRDRGLPGL